MAKKAWTLKQLELLLKLHGKMGSTSANEREAAHKHILKMLIDHDDTWNDMAELLQLARQAQQSAKPAPAPPPPPSSERATALELYQTIRAVYEDHITFDDDAYYTVCSLWCMHTHVFRKFLYTPRLVYKSPIRGSGKTEALRVTETFVPAAKLSKNATAAVFFRWTDAGYNLLLDEVDNLDLMNSPTFRAALNGGYEHDGSFDRVIQGAPVTFKTFAVVALAGIGTIPLPLARRSIVINMKPDPRAEQTRRKFNRRDAALDEDLNVIAMHLATWAHDAELTLKPPMPEQLTGGQCDVWRPLISIADACSAEVGELTREIAIRMCRGLDQDPEVVLLFDIRLIFNERRTDRLSSKIILKDLLKQPHGLWADWRGKNGIDAPRALSYPVMAKLLWDAFKIRAKTVRFGRGPADTDRGFLREQFEAAWQAYRPEADTPSQSGAIKHLR